MNQEQIHDVYESLIGVRGAGERVPGVENAFAPGTYCDQRYADLIRHRQRLWDRLGCEDDQDLEEILCAMESIQRELCFKMFEYGRKLP